VRALRELGHRVAEAELPTGLQLIRRDGSTLQGGADPRKEGVARGE
jgi:gamma-glutamyltranspeptidase/glutathione hydrolase